MEEFLHQLDAIIPPKYQAAFAFIALVLRFSGEAFSVIKTKGGLRGIVRGLLMGENVPKAVSQDYSEELGTKPAQPSTTLPTYPAPVTFGSPFKPPSSVTVGPVYPVFPKPPAKP